jgi:signal transduction histidine kinase
MADRVLALAFAAAAQAEIWIFNADDDYTVGLRLAAAVTTLVASLALAWRRTRPVASFWANSAGIVATIAVGYPSDIYQWTNLVAVYSIAVHGTNRQAWAALPAALAGVAFYFWRFPNEGDLTLAAFAAASWVVGWLAGRVYGSRIEEMHLRHERDISQRLAEANEESLAVEEERNRIARELHDIIGHSVNVMVIHAGAARRAVATDTDTVRQALDTIEATGRDALGELDRVLAVLRRDDPDPELTPTPGIADLESLAGTFRDTGLDVTIEVDGDIDAIPPSVGLAAYRIVQEALTNSLKHSDANGASVRIEAGQGRVDLVVSDDGGGDPSSLTPGRGIRGMTERAAMHNGAVTVVANPGAGVLVSGHLRWETQT